MPYFGLYVQLRRGSVAGYTTDESWAYGPKEGVEAFESITFLLDSYMRLILNTYLNLFSLRKRQQRTIYNNSFCIFAHTEDCFFPQEGLFLRTRRIVSSQKKDYSFEHKKDFIFAHTNKKKDRPKTKNHARGQQHLFLTFCCASVNIAHDRMQQ